MLRKTHAWMAAIAASCFSMSLDAQTLYTYDNDEDGLPGTVAAGVAASDLSWVNGPVFINACGEGFNSDTWSLSSDPFSTDYSAVQLTLTPDGCSEMTVTGMQFDVRRNPQGPQAMRYAYSTDGGASWIDAGADFAPDDNPCGSGDTYFWDIADFTTSSAVIFRAYGWDANNVNGQQSMLNGFVYGTVSGAGTTWYADADGDGYGDAGMTTVACDMPAGYVADNTDCNDADAAVNPGAAEICNGLDENCNGDIDEGLTFDTWYADMDGDGYGDAAMSVTTCDGAPAGYVADNTDCNDADAAVNPGAAEICNGLDENCNGDIDEGLTFDTWYADMDGDGYGDAAMSVTTCDGAPAGYIADNTDCNDADAAVNPAATEICGNGIDDNCDGIAEDGITATATIDGAAPVCAPLTVTLNAGPADAGNTYQWYRNGVALAGETGATFAASALRGYYQVMVTNDFCSDISDSTYVRIYDPNDPLITTFAGTDLCVNNPIKLKATFGFAPEHTYQWYRNDEAIAGANSAKYNATEAGDYYVNVFAAYPGCSYWSETITLTADCRLEAPAAAVSTIDVYPNPGNGHITIDMNAAAQEGSADLHIVNMIGEVIYSTIIAYNNASIVAEINLAGTVPSGMYTVIVNENGVFTQQQFIVQK